MSLSQLLSRAKPHLSGRITPVGPSVVMFFSLTDGRSRARTLTAHGADFATAWLTGSKLCQAYALHQKLNVTWLRVDWVTQVEQSTWGDLAHRLASTKRNYFRHGLSLDADFKHAFLEPEINATAMLYLGSDKSEAGLNTKNFTLHAQRRFGSQYSLDLSTSDAVWLFTHEGAFFTADAALSRLPRGSDDVVWVSGPRAIKTKWRDASSLNAGRRQLGTLQVDDVFRLVSSSAQHLAQQVQVTGQFIYGHFPCFGRRIATYNALRHASTIYSMLEGWELLQQEPLLSAIRRALGYLTRTLIRDYTQPNGSVQSYVVEANGEVKLGANAVSLLALVKYDQLTGDTQYRPLMERLALGIERMQNPQTGQFVHVLNGSDLSLKDAYRIVYYDGEAAFGLMRLYGLTRDQRWLRIVEKAFEYFLQADYWQYRDHWLSYCVNELTLYKPEKRYFRFGVQNIVGLLDFVLTRETTYPTLMELSMAFKAMLTRIECDHPDMKGLLHDMDVDKFHIALHHRAHYLLNGFFWPELAMFFSKPHTVVGSFFIRHHSFRVRIDDIQHYLSGYVAYWRMLNKNPQPITF